MVKKRILIFYFLLFNLNLCSFEKKSNVKFKIPSENSLKSKFYSYREFHNLPNEISDIITAYAKTYIKICIYNASIHSIVYIGLLEIIDLDSTINDLKEKIFEIVNDSLMKERNTFVKKTLNWIYLCTIDDSGNVKMTRSLPLNLDVKIINSDVSKECLTHDPIWNKKDYCLVFELSFYKGNEG